MLKVLHIIQGCGGGVASLLGNLIRTADKEEIRQDVMSFTYENGERFIEILEEAGSQMFLLPRPRKEGMKAFKRYMLEVMRANGYDVVHCHTDGWRSSIYRKVARKAGVPVFCIHAHRASNDPGLLGSSKAFIRLNQWCSRKNADIKFACGEAAAKFIYGDVDDHVVIPNGIDLEKCHGAAMSDRTVLRSQLGIRDGQIVVLQVGRLVTQKNHGFTVRIARALEEQGIPFKLLVAGTGGLEQQIRGELEAQGLTDRVTLLGRRDDVYRLMAMADVMILPSLYEGLPTVAIEAQAMGLYSILADTITSECDMGLGLVRQLPIDGGATCWAEAISHCREIPVPPQDQIDQALLRNAYTAETSVQRYVRTLDRHISGRAVV